MISALSHHKSVVVPVGRYGTIVVMSDIGNDDGLFPRWR